MFEIHRSCLNIGVSRAILDQMAQLFATQASRVLQIFTFAFLSSELFVLVVILFADMLRKLTSGLVFAALSAAPPDLASVLVSVCPTGPVEVLFLVILLAALLAQLDALIYLALATF